MKKLGLCVRYDCNNYGSMLQIFATQQLIKDHHWDYEIIRYDKKTILFYFQNLTRVFNPYFVKGKVGAVKKKLLLKKYSDIEKKCNHRIKRINDYRISNIGPYSPFYRGYKNIQNASKKYDAIMVGSDQLWTPAGIKSKFYNLLFVSDNVRKISLATSFGVKDIPFYQRKTTAKYLDRIEFLSTRELNGRRIIKELIGRNALVALDPTLMYDSESWNVFFRRKKTIDEPYIFAYFLGENDNYRDEVEKFAKKKHLVIVTCPFMDCFNKRDLDFGDRQLYDVDPTDFLNLIRNAEYVCTDSFHGTVFSILNHKKFITFNRTRNDDKQTRNSRIDSLFSILDLESRRYCGNPISSQIDDDIDYVKVDLKLLELRKETNDFIKEALK
ncbi:polysaccharide pyruvyl transferase family protein [Butyrivibrio sp. TB]|uniref:polysaccharide pyruvyl transferase family protein n=1 Tax=Butyrivibrio sp. TB TaxID=1520809 RepID=UPI0008B59F90|nr:polysaccharide pyruvyl transferase family protein [Butyrivibrio sp. TB]SEQ25317.1 Polysaccharide pyruvyl transferase [Butyrivibrio sp. TB]